MRRIMVCLLGLLAASRVEGQTNPYREMNVRSCPYADSLLGPIKDDHRGDVRGFYHTERDTTYLVTWSGGKLPNVTSSTKFAGKVSPRGIAIQLSAYVRGPEGERLYAAAKTGPVDVTLVADDSITVAPATTALGTYVGPMRMISLPVSALLEGDELLKVANARHVVVKAGPASVKLSNDDRRELRAIIRVVACTQ
jgi:hypothetical protein